MGWAVFDKTGKLVAFDYVIRRLVNADKSVDLNMRFHDRSKPPRSERNDQRALYSPAAVTGGDSYGRGRMSQKAEFHNLAKTRAALLRELAKGVTTRIFLRRGD